MRKHFVGYYRPTDQEFNGLWRDCIFAFDANVLLNLYRYSESSVRELVASLTRLQDRIWLPHQAGDEFHRNRLAVIRSQVNAYEEVEKVLENAQAQLAARLQQYRDHPLLKADELRKRLARGINPLKKSLKEMRERHPDYTSEDPILSTVSNLFAGRVGEPYDADRLKAIKIDGAARFAVREPPGYADRGKDGEDRKYGDLVMWFQLIDKAKADNKPLIFVTDDAKDDWWWIDGGKTQGPRPELIAEFREKAGTAFYAYLPDRFLEREVGVPASAPRKAAIAEVKQIREETERRRLLHPAQAALKEIDDARKDLGRLIADHDSILSRLAELSQAPSQKDVRTEVEWLQNSLPAVGAAIAATDAKLKFLQSISETEIDNLVEALKKHLILLGPPGATGGAESGAGGSGPTGPLTLRAERSPKR